MAMTVAMALSIRAQVTTDPNPLQENSKDVVIYFHADQGSKGLMGQPKDAHIYAHTGVCVINQNGETEEWKYAPKWTEDLPKYQLEYVSENLWKLYIGNIRDFYGVPANETVTRLCFVFRNTGGTAEGKSADGGDIFVDVLDDTFQVILQKSVSASVLTSPTEVTFTARATAASNIKLYVNDSMIAEGTGVKSLVKAYAFNTIGNYTVKAVAVSGSETSETTLGIVYAKESQPATDQTVPPMGVTKQNDGSYTFCVAAPEKKSVMLVGSWNNYQPSNDYMMEYVDKTIESTPFRHFVLNLPGNVTGTEFGYYYLVDGEAAVGDPYARLVLDPYNDRYISSEVYPDMPAYPQGLVPANTPLAWYADNLLDYKWTMTDFKGADKDNLVIYEMLFRDFTGTEGKADGNGTVLQALDKLPYLKELGINAVELLPINEFNGNNSWGYNPNFYFAVDKAYGTPQDYKLFIDECHKAGIAVILDVVFNQTDGMHPWLQMYGGIEKSPFYNFNLGGNNGAPHAYSVLNDWNQGYPLVEQQWYDVVKFWLSEYKVDGFRFDLVKGLGDNTSYANASEDATNVYNPTRVARMKRIHDAMREVNPEAYFINENLAGAEEENQMAADGELSWANVNPEGLQFAMGYDSNSALARMWAVRDNRTAGSTVSYLESHDEQRLAYKQLQDGAAEVKNNHAFAMQRCGSAAAQMIMAPGSHMIWQFSEMGNAQNTKTSIGNDTSPKIVNWNLLNDPDNYGLYKNYCELIGIRLQNTDLFASPNYQMNFANTASCRYAYVTSGDKELYLVVNPSLNATKTQIVPFLSNDNSRYHVASKSYGSQPAFDASGMTVTVQPNCYVVISTKNISGVERAVSDGMSGPAIYALDGGVKVTDNEGSDVAVYTLDGSIAAMARGNVELPLASGLYIVRAGGKVAKIIIR